MKKQITDNLWQFSFKQFGSCVYLLKIEDKNILIDTSSKQNREKLLDFLNEIGIKKQDIDFILLTHTHYDHTENAEIFPAKVLENKEEIENLGFKVIKTPGHTKDSKCFLYKKILFSGDTKFEHGIGRTDFPESSPQEMHESLKKIENLDYEILCPGHL